MRKIISVLILLALYASAQEGTKLWIEIESHEHDNEVIFIQDRETGTRCYAITNSKVNMSRYAIACVPRQ